GREPVGALRLSLRPHRSASRRRPHAVAHRRRRTPGGRGHGARGRVTRGRPSGGDRPGVGVRRGRRPAGRGAAPRSARRRPPPRAGTQGQGVAARAPAAGVARRCRRPRARPSALEPRAGVLRRATGQGGSTAPTVVSGPAREAGAPVATGTLHEREIYPRASALIQDSFELVSRWGGLNNETRRAVRVTRKIWPNAASSTDRARPRSPRDTKSPKPTVVRHW